MVPRMTTAEEHQEKETAPKSGRRPALIILIAIGVLAIPAVVLLATGRSPDPRTAPEGWEEPDLDNAEQVELDEKDYRAVVVISAGEEVCWNAYISSKNLEGCGPATYQVSGAGPSLGVNVESTELEKRFLGLAVWDGEGEQLLERGTTEKKGGVVALDLGLPPDV